MVIKNTVIQNRNEDTEIATLGSIIIDGRLIESLASVLQPEDFYSTKHQNIFRVMLDMFKRDIAIDAVTLSNELKSKGWLDDIGGFPYLDYLRELTPSSANYKYYADTVKKAANKRRFLTTLNKVSSELEAGKIDTNIALTLLNGDEEFAKAIEDSTKESIFQLSKEFEPPARQWLLEDFIPLGFPTTLYSNGGSGKSYLAINISVHACLGGSTFLNRCFNNEPINTLYLDYELDKTEMIRRTLEVIKGMGLDTISANFFYRSPDAKIFHELDTLKSFIKNNKIKFMIIDSMGAAGLDSMDEKAVIEVYSKLRQLGVTTLVIDHQSKMQTQDSPENKSPFGSVYKYNMSRSVIHLVHEKNIDNGFTVKLVHKKSNFGKLCDEELIDMVFDSDRVYIRESNSITQREEEMLMIKDSILEMLKEQEYVIQKDIIEHFAKSISKNRIIELLKKGESKHWEKVKANNKNTFHYYPLDEPKNLKIQKSQYIYSRNSGILESDMPDLPNLER